MTHALELTADGEFKPDLTKAKLTNAGVERNISAYYWSPDTDLGLLELSSKVDAIKFPTLPVAAAATEELIQAGIMKDKKHEAGKIWYRDKFTVKAGMDPTSEEIYTSVRFINHRDSGGPIYLGPVCERPGGIGNGKRARFFFAPSCPFLALGVGDELGPAFGRNGPRRSPRSTENARPQKPVFSNILQTHAQ